MSACAGMWRACGGGEECGEGEERVCRPLTNHFARQSRIRALRINCMDADVLAPIISRRAGVASVSLLKVRKWLDMLTRASLLSGSGAKGVQVHDLVRDVMMARADAADGGMVGLQVPLSPCALLWFCRSSTVANTRAHHVTEIDVASDVLRASSGRHCVCLSRPTTPATRLSRPSSSGASSTTSRRRISRPSRSTKTS